MHFWQSAAISIIPAILSAFLASGLTALFSLGRFRQEKVWEREAAAYTAIFEALHDMKQWYEDLLNEHTEGKELSEDNRNSLSDNYLKAVAVLSRRLDSETWLIPQQAHEYLYKMQSY